jgi:DNA-directed RNA polymerase subunit E'/Rpb7
MSKVVLTKRVYLDSKYLDSDILGHLLTVLKENTKNDCTKDNGHILDIIRIIDIVDNEGNVFIVRFEANTLKPEPGSSFQGVVCMVYRDGIFINIKERQKMLIPVTNLKGYTFDQTRSAYVKGKKVIANGTEVFATVTASKYNKGNFSCFGSLKE